MAKKGRCKGVEFLCQKAGCLLAGIHTRAFALQGVSGALTVLMKDAVKPNLMQTLEVSRVTAAFLDQFSVFTLFLGSQDLFYLLISLSYSFSQLY